MPTFAEIHTPGHIGQVGDLSNSSIEGDLKNGGKWEVGQKTSEWQSLQFENFPVIAVAIPTQDDSPNRTNREISKRKALFFDRPGLPKELNGAKLLNGISKFNIIVYAQNGKQYCSTSFHLTVSIVNRNPSLNDVGGGHYK